jgi:hypothetical protein
MQNIHAIFWGKWPVPSMSYVQIPEPQMGPIFALTADRYKSIFKSSLPRVAK